MVTKRKSGKSRVELIAPFSKQQKSGGSSPEKRVRVIKLDSKVRVLVESESIARDYFPVARIVDASLTSMAKNKYGVGKPAPSRIKLSPAMFEKLAMEISR
jgi:hypothetical protein